MQEAVRRRPCSIPDDQEIDLSCEMGTIPRSQLKMLSMGVFVNGSQLAVLTTNASDSPRPEGSELVVPDILRHLRARLWRVWRHPVAAAG